MVCCAVFGCKSNAKASGAGKVAFFRFPKTKKLEKVWINYCKRKDVFNPNTSRICSQHFKCEDIENFMAWQIGNFRPILKRNALPTTTITLETDRSKRIEKRTTLKNAIDRLNKQDLGCMPKDDQGQNEFSKKVPILNNNQDTRNSSVTNKVKQPTFNSVSSEIQTTTNTPASNVILKTLDASNNNKAIITKDNENVESENSKTEPSIDQLKRRIYFLKTENQKLKDQKEFWKLKWKRFVISHKRQMEAEHTVAAFRTIFTPAQIRCLKKNNKKFVKWTEEDIRKGLSVSALGRKTFQFIRKNLQYPLPGLSTLRRWTDKMPLGS